MSKTPEQIVQDITDSIGAVNKYWADPEMLSAINLRISLAYEGLGNLVTDAESAMDDLKHDYELNVDQLKLSYVQEGDSATVAESKAKIELALDYKAYLKAKSNYNQLKRRREAVESILDQSRSRLSLIRGDIRQQ